MTQWVPISELGTLWSRTTNTPTDYRGSIISDLDGLMDDTTYIMDDAVLTISDATVSSSAAPPAVWTNV